MNAAREIDRPGQHMARELCDCLPVFAAAMAQDCTALRQDLEALPPKAIFTIARGSSDAAANVISYAAMRAKGLPVTSLPPSVFSLDTGVAMAGHMGLIISQSGQSSDLVGALAGIAARGGRTVAITNAMASPVADAADCVLDISAGPEHAVPATKSVTGALGAGAAIFADAASIDRDLARLQDFAPPRPAQLVDLAAALAEARSIYVVGRGCGYGTAHEIALKLKECAALHAEAYSAAEVLHGPLQMATRAMVVLILDTGEAASRESLDIAATRFEREGAHVFRFGVDDFAGAGLMPITNAAVILRALYEVILDVALGLGLDPDSPSTLSKVTRTL